MRKIQNTNISFRATDDLKQQLTKFCEENDFHNSFVVRQALVLYLKRWLEEKSPNQTSEPVFAMTSSPATARG